MATLAEADPLAVVDLDSLKDRGKDLLSLLFIYSFEQQIVTLPFWNLRRDHSERTKLVKALSYYLRQVLDRGLLADRVDFRRMRTKARIGQLSTYLWILTSLFFSVLSYP